MGALREHLAQSALCLGAAQIRKPLVVQLLLLARRLPLPLRVRAQAQRLHLFRQELSGPSLGHPPGQLI